MEQPRNKTKIIMAVICVINLVLIGIVIVLIVNKNSDDDDSSSRRKTSSSIEESDTNGKSNDDEEKTTDKDKNKKDLSSTPAVSRDDETDLKTKWDKSTPQIVAMNYFKILRDYEMGEEEITLIRNPRISEKLGLSEKVSTSNIEYVIVQCKQYSYSKLMTEGIKAYISDERGGNASCIEETAIVEVKSTEYESDSTPRRVYFTLCMIDNEWYIFDITVKEPDELEEIRRKWEKYAY